MNIIMTHIVGNVETVKNAVIYFVINVAKFNPWDLLAVTTLNCWTCKDPQYFKTISDTFTIRPVTFKVDEKSLEQKFKEKQKVTHPDKFSTASDVSHEI